jgi:hypothetical protein
MLDINTESAAKQIKLLAFRRSELARTMLQDEIKGHHAALDCKYLVLPSIAIVRLTDEVIQWLRTDMVKDTVSAVRCRSHMVVPERSFEEVLVKLTAVLADEKRKLPPDEVATV